MKTRQYNRQCHGKRGFLTWVQVHEEIARSHKARADVIPYFCPWCRLWHIGHRKGVK